jgi:hypothetical protein
VNGNPVTCSTRRFSEPTDLTERRTLARRWDHEDLEGVVVDADSPKLSRRVRGPRLALRRTGSDPWGAPTGSPNAGATKLLRSELHENGALLIVMA